MKSTLPAPVFEPVDQAAYDHQRMLFKARHCAHPVLYQKKNAYIQDLHVGESGGRIVMTVYLKGSSEPIDSNLIDLARTPK